MFGSIYKKDMKSVIRFGILYSCVEDVDIVTKILSPHKCVGVSIYIVVGRWTTE